MTSFSVDASDIKRMLSRLKASEKTIEAQIKLSISNITLRTVAALKKYPPPPPASTYERTGRLGRGWKQQISSSQSNMIGKITNNVDYVVYVQDRVTQAKVHRRTGWRVIQDFFTGGPEGRRLVSDEMSRALREITKAIAR